MLKIKLLNVRNMSVNTHKHTITSTSFPWTAVCSGSVENMPLYIFCKTYLYILYNSLQFPAETNTGVSKALATFIPFHTSYDYARSLVNKDLFLHGVMTSKHFYRGARFVNKYILMFAVSSICLAFLI